MSGTSGQSFFKMSGSGNDFIFFDTSSTNPSEIETPDIISKLCTRRTGIGADGVVVMFDATEIGGDVGIRYYNADGSRAALCGNGTLCTVSLAVTLRKVDPADFSIATDSGVLGARISEGVPEFDLPTVIGAQTAYSDILMTTGELRLGYVTVGVPHIVIQVPDVSTADVLSRGRLVRNHPSLPNGANVNFVSRAEDNKWFIRTYERGVEDETLACGTGNVATAVLLNAWGEVKSEVEFITRSGKILRVCLRKDQTNPEQSGTWYPSLRGEGRLVFQGKIENI